VQINSSNETQSFEAEIIKQAEAGTSTRAASFQAPLPGSTRPGEPPKHQLHSTDRRRAAAPVEVVNVISTRSYGTEAPSMCAVGGLSFRGNATYEHDIYTKYTPVAACTDCVGNFMQRQPNILGNLGLYYRTAVRRGAVRFLHGPHFCVGLEQHRAAELPHSQAGCRLHPYVAGRRRARAESASTICSTARPFRRFPARRTLQNWACKVLPRRIMARLSYEFLTVERPSTLRDRWRCIFRRMIWPRPALQANAELVCQPLHSAPLRRADEGRPRRT